MEPLKRDEAGQEVKEVEDDAWKLKNHRFRYGLLQTVDPQNRAIVSGVSNARQCWSLIKDHHGQAKSQIVYSTLKSLFLLNMSSSDSVQTTCPSLSLSRTV